MNLFQIKFCAITFFIVTSSILIAQEYAFSGVYHESKVPTQYWNNMSWDSFVNKNKSLRGKGYQLIDFEAQHIGKGKSGRFWGVWQKTNIKTRIKSIGGWENFKKLCMDQLKEGFVLDDVESIINRNGNRIYIGLFSKGKKRQAYFKFRSMDELKKQNKIYEDSNGPTLVDVDQFTTNDGKNQYLAIYDDTGQGSRRTKLVTSRKYKEFNEKRSALKKSGWQLFDYEEFDYKNNTYYMGVFQKLRKPHSLWRNLNWHSFKAHRSHLSRHRGMKLIDIELKKGKGKTNAPDSYIGKIKQTPDIWQHIPESNRAGKLFASNEFCGPTAVSNGIMYWVKNGYPKLDPYNSQIEMVKILGNHKHMNSSNGTGFKGMVKGLRKYLSEHGSALDHAYIWHIGTPKATDDLQKMKDVSIKTDLGKININKTHRSIINQKSTTIALWGRYTKDDKENLERIGGHYVTLVGYGQDKQKKLDKNILIVHNPSTNEDKPKQEYLKVTPLVGVDGITSSTKLYRENEDEKEWEETCKNKQLLKKKERSGEMNYYILEAILDFRI